MAVRNWRVAVALLVGCFFGQMALYRTGALALPTNYRLGPGLVPDTALAIARAHRGLPLPPTRLNSADEVGPSYLLAGLLLLGSSDAGLVAMESGKPPPFAYFFLMSLPLLFALLLLYFALRELVDARFALIASLAFALSRSAGLLSFAGDVYFFPVFSASAVLAWAAVAKSRPRWAVPAAAAAAALLALSDFFRMSGLFLLGPAILLACFPHWLKGGSDRRTRGSALALLAVFGVLHVASSSGQHHPVWHSIHAGLFEFGGWKNDSRGLAVPSFATDESIPEGSQSNSKWDDLFEAAVLRKFDPQFVLYGTFRPEYDEVLRRETLRWVTAYPGGALALVLKRAWRGLVVNPWQPTEDNTTINFGEPADSFFRLLLLGGFAAGLLAGAARERVFWLISAMLPVGLPVFAVHSGYLMYSFPLHAIVLLLWLYCMRQYQKEHRGSADVTT